MAARKPTILVVTDDPEPSDAMSAWLRQAGLRVLACQAHNPRHTPVSGVAAIAARSPWMPMWSSLISGWPATPCCGARPPCSSLSYYRDLGKAVVALQRLGGPPGSFPGDGVELVPWPPTRRELLGAVLSQLPGSQAHARYMSGQRTKSLENWRR